MKLQDTWAVTQHDTHGFWHRNRNISISISRRCRPLWFKQKPAEQRASERTSNTPPVRSFPFRTRPGKTFWTAPQRNPDYSTMPLSFSACNVKWMKMELQRSWSQSGGKKEETAQRGWIKPWVICGQDWTAAPQRFGHARHKENRAEETLNSCEAAAGRHTSPPLASMDEPGNGGRSRYTDRWINSPQRRVDAERGGEDEREENTGGEKDECSSHYKDTERKTILQTTSTRHTASVLWALI